MKPPTKPEPPPPVACLGIAQLKDGACGLVLLQVSAEPASQGRRQRVVSQRVLCSSTDRGAVERQFREEAFAMFNRRGEPRQQKGCPHGPGDVAEVEALGLGEGPKTMAKPYGVIRVEVEGGEVTLLESKSAHARRMDACDDLDREAALTLLTEERRRGVGGAR